MVESLIGRLDRWLAANRPDYYALLRPGASDAELDTVEAQFSLELPAAFRALYRWRDGQDPLSFVPLQMNRTFMPLEDIARVKDMLDGMIGYDFDDPGYWRRGWVPFLHNGGGSYLCLDLTAEEGGKPDEHYAAFLREVTGCLDLAAEDSGKPGQLVGFWKADDDRPVEFPSVEAWLAVLVESAEAGKLELV